MNSRIASYGQFGATSSNGVAHKRLVRLGFGRLNYCFTFISDSLTILFFVSWDIVVMRAQPLLVAVSVALGLGIWTLVEYVFHRWVYHKGETSAHIGHMIHHESPETLIAMPWFVVTAGFGGVWYVATQLIQVGYLASVAAGLLFGFVIYGLFHHVLHRLELRFRWYRRLRAHHKVHHQFPDVNFGVTSRFWDQLLGTTHQNRLRSAKR